MSQFGDVVNFFSAMSEMREVQATLCARGAVLGIVKMQKVGQRSLFGDVRPVLRQTIRLMLAFISVVLLSIGVNILAFDRLPMHPSGAGLVALLDALMMIQAAAGCDRWKLRPPVSHTVQDAVRADFIDNSLRQ